jgi:hypothetical protein
MSFDGSGVFNRPVSAYVFDTVISETDMNTEMDGIATGLSNCITKDGQQTVTATIPMNSNKFSGLSNGSAAGDSANLGQIQAEAYIWCGTMTGTADAGVLSPSPAITAYAAGQRFAWLASANSNTGAMTVAISGLSTIAVQNDGAALVAADHVANKLYIGILDTTGTIQIQRIVALSLVPSDIGVTVQAYDADTLFADTADVLTAGFATTPYSAGTKSSGTYTPDEANGNFQYAVNGGAHTLAPPTNNSNIIVQYTNNASAGAITTSGFTKVTGSFTTTDGDDFFAYITKNNGFSLLQIVALQ